MDQVTDGDTVALWVDMGWRLHADYACRIVLDKVTSIDTPEKKHPDYAASVRFAKTLLAPGDKVVVESVRMTDKYGGRFAGILWLPDGRTFGAAMIEAGYALAWREGQPKPYPKAGT